MPGTRFSTFDPNSEGFNEIYKWGERASSQGSNNTNTFPNNNAQSKALDNAGFSLNSNVNEGIGSIFDTPVSQPIDYSSINWSQPAAPTQDTDLANYLRQPANTTGSSNMAQNALAYGNNTAPSSTGYRSPSNRERVADAFVSSQKAISQALVSNLGQSTAMGWAGFAIQAAQSVANIALSIEQYKLGKKQFKQAKREYAYNVDKREQAIHDTVATRAEQGGLTGQAKEEWMSSRGVNANRY